MINESGPLYARKRRDTEQVAWLQGQEEVLNQIFNITFAIAPDELVRAAFFEPLGIADSGPFESIGREAATRYGWLAGANVTQQDALFVSKSSAVAVELKLGSASWPEQVLKYAALLAWEERVSGRRVHLGLLYIVPKGALERHWGRCGLERPAIDRSFFSRVAEEKLPSTIADLIGSDRESVASVLDRLELGVVSWSDLRNTMNSFRAIADTGRPGDQTLTKLIDGFVAQLDAHSGTGIDS